MSFSAPENENPIGYSNDEIDQLLESVMSQPLPTNITQSISTPSLEIKECGWTSPPRAVVIASSSSSSTRLSNKTTLIPRDLNCIETDLKPTGNFHNHSLKFIEDYQNELEQIKDEYRRKFHQDQTRLEDEITRLIHHEQMTFKHHQRTNSNHKRKHY